MRAIAEQLGVGLGYRQELAKEMEDNLVEIDFVEIVGDHCFHPSLLSQIRNFTQKVPNVCHFLNLSVGTDEPLDEEYLDQVSDVLEQLRPVLFSDHLAMTRVQGVDIGHLAPVAFTEETVKIVTGKVVYLQERFGLPFLLENITYHFALPDASLAEWELLTRIVEQADCGILLDLNNVYVNAHNHGYDPYEFLRRIPLERVLQIHIGGGVLRDGIMIDSHGHPIEEPVFELLKYVCDHSPVSAILLERDKNMPPFEELAHELRRARSVLRNRSSASVLPAQ